MTAPVPVGGPPGGTYGGGPYNDPWWKTAIQTAVPIVAGAISTGGDIYANQKNIELAREQMAFQERMSNTAVQRSVQDYLAAGLNPALAYDRSASSPSGTSATIGNPTAGGVSTALQARQAMQAMQMARQQNVMDLNLKNAQRAKAAEDAALSHAQAQKIDQDARFQSQLQPYMMRNNAAEALLKEYVLPGAKAQAQWDEWLGKGGPGINSAKSLLSALDLMSKMAVRHP